MFHSYNPHSYHGKRYISQDLCNVTFTWSEVYFPSHWIWAGHVIYLTNRLWQKWHFVTTGLRSWNILQFHNHSLEVSYHVKKVWTILLERPVKGRRPCGMRGPLLFSRSVMSDSLPPHGLQHSSLPCPSLSPGGFSNSCPFGRWCHPTISSSVTPFSTCLLSQPQGLFQRVGSSHQVAKILELLLQHQSFQW